MLFHIVQGISSLVEELSCSRTAPRSELKIFQFPFLTMVQCVECFKNFSLVLHSFTSSFWL
jgi:hypothetical protein